MDTLHPSFILILRQTYYRTGFFNVNVDNERYFGEDNENIEIYCGDNTVPIIGKINRRANNNHTPRIMGGRVLKKWFIENSCVYGKIKVKIINQNRISLEIIK
jgi:hypothetical protein